ncbi:MAG: alpha/beta hydrolase [Gloeobacteraceae cyanobacterium ES-bin-316]|nr:alpha/beta hydrolase [Ferruginibacter sp.]
MKIFLKRLLKTLLVVFILFNIMVIFHAYKLTHFYDRTKPNTEAIAKKSTWNTTKAILMGANALKSENVAPDTIVQNVYFTTKDNLKLAAWFLPATAAKGTIAMFHGHGSKKSALLSEAAIFRSLGYNTLLIDFRAHGDSEGNTCTIGYKETEEVKLAYDYLKAKGEKNIVLFGISLGASTITKAVNEHNLKPARVILEMPFGSLFDAVKGRLKIMQLPPQPLATMLTFWGGTIHGFFAFNLKPAEYAKKIECPVLLQWGKNDPRVSRSETELIYNNIIGPKKLVLYENSAHESLCKKETAKWTNEVTAFLQ